MQFSLSYQSATLYIPATLSLPDRHRVIFRKKVPDRSTIVPVVDFAGKTTYWLTQEQKSGEEQHRMCVTTYEQDRSPRLISSRVLLRYLNNTLNYLSCFFKKYLVRLEGLPLFLTSYIHNITAAKAMGAFGFKEEVCHVKSAPPFHNMLT
jgi:hypothetical protein